MKIAVIGGGIAGLWVAKKLSEKHKVTLFDGEFSLGASQNSTAIISTFGIKTGISPWGDTLYKASKFALKAYEDFESVIKAKHYYLPSVEVFNTVFEDDNYKKRFSHLNQVSLQNHRVYFEDCLIGDGRLFRDEILSKKSFEIKKSFVLSLNELRPDFDKIILCQGYHRNQFNLTNHSSLSKPRKGEYLEWVDLNNIKLPLGLESNANNHIDIFGDFYLSYRHDWKKLVLGTNNSVSDDYFIDRSLLKQFYEKVSKYISLPEFDQAEIKLGIRDLNTKRKAELKDLGEGIWALTGLHKNGWTLAPYFANQLNDYLS